MRGDYIISGKEETVRRRELPGGAVLSLGWQLSWWFV